METIRLPKNYTHLATNGSEIRELVEGKNGGFAHCLLPPLTTASAAKHRTVEEVRFILSGEGQMWRKLGSKEEIIELMPGTGITIPTGTYFQFRNTGDSPLELLIACMPNWPGPEEAVPVSGVWGMGYGKDSLPNDFI